VINFMAPYAQNLMRQMTAKSEGAILLLLIMIAPCLAERTITKEMIEECIRVGDARDRQRVEKQDSLAPHPIYFSIDGRPAQMRTPEGEVKWSGSRLELVNSIKADWKNNESGSNLIGILIIFSICFWFGFAYFIFGMNGVVNLAIGMLVLFLILSIWNAFKR